MIDPAAVPLSDQSNGEVLCCIDRRTEWRWYYAIDSDSQIRRYHEFHDYAGEAVACHDVAMKLGFDRASPARVIRMHLDVDRGVL